MVVLIPVASFAGTVGMLMVAFGEVAGVDAAHKQSALALGIGNAMLVTWIGYAALVVLLLALAAETVREMWKAAR